MLLVTGLGNPGKEYEKTPHNAGFLFVEELREYLEKKGAEVYEWENEEKLFSSQICKIKVAGKLVCILQKPLTYMNRSGSAVKLLLDKFEVDELVLAHDDLDISLGRYKIQKEKSPKGHRGVFSVEESLGRSDFYRVRIGVENRENTNITGEEYVLRKYSAQELDDLKYAVQTAAAELATLFEL